MNFTEGLVSEFDGTKDIPEMYVQWMVQREEPAPGDPSFGSETISEEDELADQEFVLLHVVDADPSAAEGMDQQSSIELLVLITPINETTRLHTIRLPRRSTTTIIMHY
jgi:hypothetical protein